MYGYVEREYDSSGAVIRIAMNALPALLLLLYRRRFAMRSYERRLWLVLALIALALVPALVLSPSSTAVDRVALYMLPLQLLVLSRVPDAFAPSERAARMLGLLVVIYSAAVQFVWLNYASHADAWVPYQLYPF